MLKRLQVIVTACLGSGATWPVVLVVAGLLSVPTTCRCGAALPHDHALYVLGTHDHDLSGHDPARLTLDADQHGAAVQAMTSLALGDAHAATVTGWADADRPGSAAATSAGILPPPGRDVTPVTPPPRA